MITACFSPCLNASPRTLCHSSSKLSLKHGRKGSGRFLLLLCPAENDASTSLMRLMLKDCWTLVVAVIETVGAASAPVLFSTIVAVPVTEPSITYPDDHRTLTLKTSGTGKDVRIRLNESKGTCEPRWLLGVLNYFALRFVNTGDRVLPRRGSCQTMNIAFFYEHGVQARSMYFAKRSYWVGNI